MAIAGIIIGILCMLAGGMAMKNKRFAGKDFEMLKINKKTTLYYEGKPAMILGLIFFIIGLFIFVESLKLFFGS